MKKEKRKFKPKVCPECGKSFTPKAPAQAYCSKECRKINKRKIDARVQREKRRKNRDRKLNIRVRKRKGEENLGTGSEHWIDEKGKVHEIRDKQKEKLGYKHPKNPNTGEPVAVNKVESYEKGRREDGLKAHFGNTRPQDIAAYKEARQGSILNPAWEKEALIEKHRRQKELKEKILHKKKKLSKNELPESVLRYREHLQEEKEDS